MPDIRQLITIQAGPDKVYPLVGQGQGLSQWWAEDVWPGTDPPDTIALGFFNRATVYQLRIVSHSPLQQIVWRCETGGEWADTTLDFRLERQKTATLLHFEHRSWRAETEYFLHCSATWGALLYRLRAAAEGKAPGPLFTTSTVAV
jgi:uncharacterized protein YndB with AHSA1/START domain